MDVRCDRCQTEYELDDESVTGGGASVQCTTCGHTFVVSPNGSIMVGTTPPSGLAPGEPAAMGSRSSSSGMSAASGLPTTTPGMGAPESLGGTPPPAPEWVLATEEGQTHRLRDLTTLQKWVVERRVGRGDRVSNRGGPWRLLGDVDELRPFLDIVAEADRQTGNRAAAAPRAADAARAVRPTRPETPRKVQNAVRAHVSPDLDDDDVLSSGSAFGRRGRGADAFLDSGISDDDLSRSIRPKRTGLKVVGALAFVGLAAGAWYVGFRDPHGFRVASGAPVPTPSAPAPAAPAPAPAVAPAAAASAPVAPAGTAPPVAAAAGSAGTPAPAAIAVPAPAPEAPKPAAAPPVEAAKPEDTEGAKPAPTAEAPKPVAPAKPRTYEQLVADGDHALENGQTAKAQKLYDEALRMQPQGVSAMTGSAYVLMDKRRPLAAIGLFKQALSNSPHFAPALFGLGEAYRSQGDAAKAVEAYKSYLEQSPTGVDAPAARRQIKDLGEAAAAPRHPGPSAVVPESASGN